MNKSCKMKRGGRGWGGRRLNTGGAAGETGRDGKTGLTVYKKVEKKEIVFLVPP